jgi:membrane protein
MNRRSVVPTTVRKLRGRAVAPVGEQSPGGGLDSFALGLAIGLGVSLVDSGRKHRPTGSGPAASLEDGSPVDVRAHTWFEVAKRTWIEFNTDHIPAVAGGATFFALLALFPALGVFVSLYGLFADVEVARRHVLKLHGVLPEGAISVLSDQMTRLAAAPHGQLGLTFFVSLALSLWSSNAGVKALIAGLNVAYEETERRNFLRLNLVSLGFTIGFVALAVIGSALPSVLGHLGISGSPTMGLLRWPLSLAVVIVMLSILYRYAPSRQQVLWRWITPGSAFAAIAWIAMSMLFTLYVAHFGHYDKTYGSLGAVVGFMTWIWLSLTVVLLGAELNSELEQQV